MISTPAAAQPTEKAAIRSHYDLATPFYRLVWFVAVVTLDLTVLMAVWSASIVVGSVLEDRRLLHFVGDAYRDYQARVPGYPAMPFGPRARVK